MTRITSLLYDQTNQTSPTSDGIQFTPLGLLEPQQEWPKMHAFKNARLHVQYGRCSPSKLFHKLQLSQMWSVSSHFRQFQMSLAAPNDFPPHLLPIPLGAVLVAVSVLKTLYFRNKTTASGKTLSIIQRQNLGV